MYKESVTFRDYSSNDMTAADISYLFHEWNSYREIQMQYWEEIDRYIHNTDNTDFESTFNHKTFIPVAAEVHEDLQAILYSTILPHEDWLGWRPFDNDAATVQKRKAVLSYIKHAHSMNNFEEVLRKLIDDFTRYGNCFAQVNYENMTSENADGTSTPGYAGPSIKRISPYDIVFNPTASTFEGSVKVVRDVHSVGGFLTWVESLKDQGIDVNEEAIENAKQIHRGYSQTESNVTRKNGQYNPTGFTSIESFYKDGYIETMWFYGDIYDQNEEVVHKNRLIVVSNQKDILFDIEEPNCRIFKGTWKPRPDNLWGQGALDNIVGMNYMVNHRENAKNDAIDRFIYPDRVYVGDVEEIYDENTNQIKYLTPEGGSVTDITPDASVLTFNTEIDLHEQRCRRAARLPQQLAGFRSPGEKTATEVQTLNDGAFRGFINKAQQFEKEFLEKIITAEIELARDNFNAVINVMQEDDEGLFSFLEVTEDDLKSNGKLIPYGARRFSRMIQQQQGLQVVFSSPLSQFIQPHLDSYGLTKALDKVYGFEEFNMFGKFAATEEQLEQQQFANIAQQELVASTEQRTPEEITTEELNAVQDPTAPE